MTPLPHTRCPLCGAPNDCAPAGCGRLDVDCWCRDASFPAALLAQVAPAERARSCICARCAAAARPHNPKGHDDVSSLHR